MKYVPLHSQRCMCNTTPDIQHRIYCFFLIFFPTRSNRFTLPDDIVTLAQNCLLLRYSETPPTHTQARTHTNTHTHTHKRTHAHTNTHTSTHTHTNTITQTHTRTRTHTSTQTHTRTRTRTHTSTYTHKQTHTHKHTHLPFDFLLGQLNSFTHFIQHLSGQVLILLFAIIPPK
jgi:hypothetical protein